MSAREKILGRVREALRVETIRAEHGEAPAGTGAASGSRTRWMPPVGAPLTAQLDLFGKLSDKLKTEVHPVANLAEAIDLLKHMAVENEWQKMGIHSGALLDPAAAAMPCALLHTEDGYDVNELESCEVGVSECEVLVAQTGSILVTTRSSGGRALSVLPPHHVVLAREAQMVPDLSAAYVHLRSTYGNDLPGWMCFITGPSRTGDIERTLVLGAHGPKRLSVILIK